MGVKKGASISVAAVTTVVALLYVFTLPSIRPNGVSLVNRTYDLIRSGSASLSNPSQTSAETLTTPQAAPYVAAPIESLKQSGAVLPEDIVYPGDLGWAAGGVTGPSERDVVDWMQRLYEEVASNVRQQFCSTDEAAATAVIRNAMLRLLPEFSLDNDNELNNDCRINVVSSQRALCIVMAATWGGDLANGNNTHIEKLLVDVPSYRDSFCRSLCPCVQWLRGRFSVRLTSELLDEVYQKRVVPKVLSQRDAFSPLQSQFVHGEVGDYRDDSTTTTSSCATPPRLASGRHNGTAKRVTVNLQEMSVMWRRTVAEEDYHIKSETLFSRIVKRAGKSKSLSRSDSPFMATLAAAQIFRGAIPSVVEDDEDSKVVFSNHRSTTPPWSSPLKFLSPLEIVAALYHSVATQALGGELNVVVFNGDSTNREVYFTLVNIIRYGFDRQGELAMPSDETMSNGTMSPAWYPSLQFPANCDTVYKVMPTFDEISLFDSPWSSTGSNRTVEAYLIELLHLIRERKYNEEVGKSTAHLPELPLLLIIWYWEPKTYLPRRVTHLAPNRPLSSSCPTNTSFPSAYCQRSLSEVNVSVALMLSGNGYWERRLGPPYLRAFGPIRNTPATMMAGHLYLTTLVGWDDMVEYYPLAPLLVFRRGASPKDNHASEEEEENARGRVRYCRPSYMLLDSANYTSSVGHSVYNSSVDAPTAQCRNDFVSMTSLLDRRVWAYPKGCRNHHCFARNVLTLKWLNDSVFLRYGSDAMPSSQNQQCTASSLRRSRATEATSIGSQRFVWGSIAVLDRAKMKYIPQFRMGDRIHSGSRLQRPLNMNGVWDAGRLLVWLAPRFHGLAATAAQLIAAGGVFQRSLNHFIEEVLQQPPTVASSMASGNASTSREEADRVLFEAIAKLTPIKYKAGGATIGRTFPPSVFAKTLCGNRLSVFRLVAIVVRLSGLGDEAFDESNDLHLVDEEMRERQQKVHPMYPHVKFSLIAEGSPNSNTNKLVTFDDIDLHYSKGTTPTTTPIRLIHHKKIELYTIRQRRKGLQLSGVGVRSTAQSPLPTTPIEAFVDPASYMKDVWEVADIESARDKISAFSMQLVLFDIVLKSMNAE